MNWRNWLRYGAWSLLTLGLVLLTSGLLLGFVFDEAIKGVFIRELNRNLAVPVRVSEENIRFSVLRDFPDASLSFTDLSMRESVADSQEDFLHIERLALRFSLRDLLAKRYRIRRIDLENGQINLRRLKDGSVNYHFWKPSEDTAARQVDLNLEQLALRNVRVLYNDEKTARQSDVEVLRGLISGSLVYKAFDAVVDVELIPHQVPLRDKIAGFTEPWILEGRLVGDYGLRSYQLDGLTLQSGLGKLLVDGKFSTGKNSALDLVLKGEKLSLATLLEWAGPLGLKLPSDPKGGQWSGKGDLALSGQIRSDKKQGAKPELTIEFGLRDGKLTHKGLGIDLDALRFEGSYTSSGGSTLVLRELEMRQSGALLRANLSVKQFRDPVLDLEAKGSLSLAMLGPWLPPDLQDVQGRVELEEVRIRGKVRDLQEGAIQPAQAAGRIRFDGVSARWRDSDWGIAQGEIWLEDDKMVLKDLRLSGAGSRVTLNGTVRNGLAALLLPAGTSPIPSLQGRATADVFDLGALLKTLRRPGTGGPSPGEKTAKMLLPRFSGSLQTEVNTFRYGDVLLEDLEALWQFTPGYWRTSSWRGNGMGGQVDVGVSVRQTARTGILLDLEGKVNGVRIEECFRQFHDFGQKELTSQNLKGSVSGTLHHLQAEWDGAGRFLPNELLLHSDVVIRDGALINYAPVEALSRFIRVEELRNIRFSAMQNTVQIINSKINIPVMNIQSNALNLSLTGTHSFSGWLDYQVKVSLFEILGKKFSRNAPENAAYTELEKTGGMAIYVSMQGTADDLAMVYNRKDTREVFRESGDRDGLFRPSKGNKPTEWHQEADEPEFLDWGEEEENP